MTIVVRYNVERGFEEAALALARRLFAEFDEAIGSLALVPVDDEDLGLDFEGREIHSASRSGRLPRVADLLADPAAARARARQTVSATTDSDPDSTT